MSSLSAAEVQEGMSRTVQWLLGYSWREAGEGGGERKGEILDLF